MSAPNTFSNSLLYDKVTLQLQELVVKILYKIANMGEEPTKLNTNKHNSHILIDLRDEFLRNETNNTRTRTYRGLWNYLIIKYDSSNYYADRLDWVIEKLLKSNWVLLEGKKPTTHWAEDNKPELDKQRKEAIARALDNKEFDKVLNLID